MPVGIALGTLSVFVLASVTPISGTPYAFVAAGLVGMLAGALSRRRGWLAGLAALVCGVLLWSTYVFAWSWLNGDLVRTFPDCDPCGVSGYAARIGIVAAIGLVGFSIPAAVGGWLGAAIARRLLPPSSYSRSRTEDAGRHL